MQRKKIGLALGGGVVRGWAHLGVLSELEKAQIPIDYVAGTSAGSIMGAFYCAGWSIQKIYEVTKKLRWWHVARPVWPVRGLVSFDKLARYLISCLGDLDFDDLAIPFTAVATDIQSSESVALNHGRLATAVQASCSVPGFVTPVELDGRLLADGSLSDTVPVSVLHHMGAEYVIGVDIFSPLLRRKWGPIGMGLAAIEILVERAGGGIDNADCIIVPNLAGKTYVRFSKREEFYRIGQEAACQQIPHIRNDLGV